VNVVETGARFIDTGRSLIPRVARVRIVLEELGIDNFVGEPAADREGVANDRPLWFAEQTEDLSQVMEEPGEPLPQLQLTSRWWNFQTR